MNRRNFFKNLAATAAAAVLPSFFGPTPYVPRNGSTFSEVYSYRYQGWLATWRKESARGTYEYVRLNDERFEEMDPRLRGFMESDMEESFRRAGA